MGDATVRAALAATHDPGAATPEGGRGGRILITAPRKVGFPPHPHGCERPHWPPPTPLGPGSLESPLLECHRLSKSSAGKGFWLWGLRTSLRWVGNGS